MNILINSTAINKIHFPKKNQIKNIQEISIKNYFIQKFETISLQLNKTQTSKVHKHFSPRFSSYRKPISPVKCWESICNERDTSPAQKSLTLRHELQNFQVSKQNKHVCNRAEIYSSARYHRLWRVQWMMSRYMGGDFSVAVLSFVNTRNRLISFTENAAR